LRELNDDGTMSRWSPALGQHSLHVKQAILTTPEKKPCVVVCQIHDGKDDVIEVRLTKCCLEVIHNDIHYGVLDDQYCLGEIYELWITVKDRLISVKYKKGRNLNEVRMTTNKENCFFKVGCYTQSNIDMGDLADSYAEVLLFKVEVRH
jgi:Alginate lyase